jgi:hypothetical protein
MVEHRFGPTNKGECPMPILSGRVNFNKHTTPEQRAQRRAAALTALFRIYCDVIGLWRGCAKKRCKRHRRCSGDPSACIERGWPAVPRSRRPRIHAEVRAGGPARIPPINNVERRMRQDPPGWLTRN